MEKSLPWSGTGRACNFSRSVTRHPEVIARRQRNFGMIDLHPARARHGPVDRKCGCQHQQQVGQQWPRKKRISASADVQRNSRPFAGSALRQPTRQHRPRVLEIDHLFQAGSENIVCYPVSRGSISLRLRRLLFQFLRVFNVTNSMNFLTQTGLQWLCRADYLFRLTQIRTSNLPHEESPPRENSTSRAG